MIDRLPHNPLQQGNNVFLDVKVIPEAHKNMILGWINDYFTVKLAAPREKGKANSALIELIAHEFSLAKSQVEIVSGSTSRIKRLCLHACSLDLVRKRS